MDRAPCCDKISVKKGPWTPEEDIVLVTYIQEHGSSNWRAIPTNTGLRRCSKSCRLRWTNYLRPGIRRGNFTEKEEKLIVHLQALLGNRWAAIATYLPERTDNDIKNYWNTHLRKKLRKQRHDDTGDEPTRSCTTDRSRNCRSMEKGQWERCLQADIHKAKQALRDALSLETPRFMSKLNQPSPASSTDASKSPSTLCRRQGDQCSHQVSAPSTTSYASSAENISRLLRGWARPRFHPKPQGCAPPSAGRSNSQSSDQLSSSSNPAGCGSDSASSEGAATTTFPKELRSSDALHTLFGLSGRTSNPSELPSGMTGLMFPEGNKQMPLSVLETWLLDDGVVGHGLETNFMDMSLHSSEIF